MFWNKIRIFIMRYSACVLVVMPNGEIISVSRKNDPTDIGLPGGKVDLGETVAQGAIRECLEETGFHVVLDESNPFVDFDGEFEVTTFLATIADKPPEYVEDWETGIVSTQKPINFCRGTFGEYNLKALLHFGILKKFVVYFYGGLPDIAKDIDDVVYAENSIEACKQFIGRTKGKYNVQKVVHVDHKL